MQLQLIRFDRVFSVVRHHTKWGKWTEFGFESRSTKVLQASVYGHPAIPTDIELLVAMPRQADWKNICGWSSSKTGEIVIDREHSSLAVFVVLWVAFLLAVGPLYLINAQDFNVGQHIGYLTGIVGVSVIMALVVRRALRIRTAHRLLANHMSARSERPGG